MNRDVEYVQRTYPWPPERSDEVTDTPAPEVSQVTVVHDPRPQLRQPGLQPEPPSSESQQTVIPYAPTPPGYPSRPSLPSDQEIYGPDRYYGHPPTFPNHALFPPVSPSPTPTIQFNPAQAIMASQRDPLAGRDFKDELARAAGVVTPGVDDGPYIRYALEALTRPQDDSRGLPESTASEIYDTPILPQHQIIHQQNPDVHIYRPPPTHQPPLQHSQTPVAQRMPAGRSSHSDSSSLSITAEELLRQRRQRRKELKNMFPEDDFIHQHGFDFDVEDLPPLQEYWDPAPPLDVERSPPRTVDVWQAQPDDCSNDDLGGAQQHFAPPLTHKPWVLRPQSLVLLMILCVLMITALIFCGVYSIGRNGFTSYDDTIYGGQYFLFRILPQLFGAILLVYAQSVVAAAFRVLPFSAMASDNRHERRNAVFLPMYAKTFLWPQLVGPWNLWVPTFIVWVINITIPLLSGLFTVVLVDGSWVWHTVQGIVWTLVALYMCLLLSIIVLFVYWRKRRTGMMAGWDIRTIADIIFLVSQSNSLAQYRGLETMTSRQRMKQALDGTAERLGYWFTPEAPDNYTFYGIGVATTTEDLEGEKLNNQHSTRHRREEQMGVTSDAEGLMDSPSVRYRYLPWCFRDSQIISFVAVAAALLIALITVSFMPSTDLRDGFLPKLSAGPITGSFSPADFLYAFLPSLLGMLLFLGFQSLDMTLRILIPWGELARPEGSRAETSLLLDYATCLPWEATYKAIRLRHWRVAFITGLSPLFILLPVLAGGLFMALTPPSGIVYMYPNMAAFGIILALLSLYLFALISLIPQRRRRLALPHAVTCLAEVISFVCNEQLRTDAAFDFERIGAHYDLRGTLDVGKDQERQGRWTFSRGMGGDERLGIKRWNDEKFTARRSTAGRSGREKRTLGLRDVDRRDRRRLIGAPVMGEMF
ncbi:hypothetical protein F5Y15DRAFT_232593 [Xylariaceae sp. FL0016]|nr:hypothetical protein F5Y15DRAFT_232593 [Xylariaceae sp. FL0016]